MGNEWRLYLWRGKASLVWLQWEKRDAWIGVYVAEPERYPPGYVPGEVHRTYRTIYVCALPFLPLVIRWWRPA